MKPYEEVELTEEEIKAAILEGKKKKYFHEKNKGYWEAQEKPTYVKVKIDKTIPKIYPE